MKGSENLFQVPFPKCLAPHSNPGLVALLVVVAVSCNM